MSLTYDEWRRQRRAQPDPNVECSSCGRRQYRGALAGTGWGQESGTWFCPNCLTKLKAEQETRAAEMEARGYRRVGQGHWVSPDRKFRWNGRSWLPIPRKERCWYGEGRRLAYGSVWSVYTLILLSFGIYAATQPLLGGGITFLALALASVTGAYAWVIWTWRAPILWFVIFF